MDDEVSSNMWDKQRASVRWLKYMRPYPNCGFRGELEVDEARSNSQRGRIHNQNTQAPQSIPKKEAEAGTNASLVVVRSWSTFVTKCVRGVVDLIEHRFFPQR